MKQYGLIGRSLAHSQSPQWFAAMFERQGITDAHYSLYEMDKLEGLRDFVEKENLQGFNVTIPYKKAILPYLDSVDDTAHAIGAVNCVTIEGHRLIGHNTDAPAFLDTLRPLLRSWHTSALVLGTGGAAQAVIHALTSIGIDTRCVSRTPEAHPGSLSYPVASAEASRRLLLVNATPVGMYPHTTTAPWQNPDILTPQHLCYDLVYNPPETRFLHEARQRGASICNGLAMLHRQAELSWAFWNPADGIPHHSI